MESRVQLPVEAAGVPRAVSMDIACFLATLLLIWRRHNIESNTLFGSNSTNATTTTSSMFQQLIRRRRTMPSSRRLSPHHHYIIISISNLVLQI